LRRHFLLAGLFALLPKPGRGEDVFPPPLSGIAADVLAGLIESTRSRAIAEGVRPLPGHVSRGLLGFFPDGLLRRVRYGTGDAGRAVLPALAFGYGDAAAVTLGDVVLFRDPHRALTDLKLWAHELTHVLQYQRWGIAGFAERYVSDARAVEREAYDNADRFVAWRAR